MVLAGRVGTGNIAGVARKQNVDTWMTIKEQSEERG